MEKIKQSFKKIWTAILGNPNNTLSWIVKILILLFMIKITFFEGTSKVIIKENSLIGENHDSIVIVHHLLNESLKLDTIIKIDRYAKIKTVDTIPDSTNHWYMSRYLDESIRKRNRGNK